jgi:biopolymer transport protein ExbD
VAFKPSARRTREEEEADVNLLPMMNIVCSLIALLMGCAQMTEISMLEYLPPAEAAEVEDSGSEPAAEQKKNWNNDATIDLLINIAATGYQVSLFGKNEPGPYFFEIPVLPGGEYDYKTLSARLAQVKETEVGAALGIDSVLNETTGKQDVFEVFRYKDGREVSITALGQTPFQIVVHTMDACRQQTVNGEKKELFPVAMLKQFQ